MNYYNIAQNTILCKYFLSIYVVVLAVKVLAYEEIVLTVVACCTELPRFHC